MSHDKINAADAYAEEVVVERDSLEARIRNPLDGIPRDELMRTVEVFARARGLDEHIPILRKGALIAQNPDDAGRLMDGTDEALTLAEAAVLGRERTNKWAMPARLFWTIAMCSVGAAVQGWDQTGANGATIFFPRHYGIGGDSAREQILVGLINAAPYIGSAFIGCWLSDPLNNYFGRRGTIWFSAHFCIWPVVGSALCHTWQQQLACRLLMGVGMGAKASTVPVYAAENAPASIRGALVMSWQMWTAFGIMLGTAFNLAVFHVPDINWRLMLGAPFIPAVPLLFGIYLCPESPRWYMKKGRYSDAWKAMSLLRHGEIQVARDVFYIGTQLEMEERLAGRMTHSIGIVGRFTQLFTVPRVRRANLAAVTVMLAQQMCGINIIAFYSTSIFKESGLTDFRAMIGSFGFGLVGWLFCLPALMAIDSYGRRSLLLFTFPQMFWTLLAAGLCTLMDRDMGDVRTGFVCLFVFCFAAFYSPGCGVVPYSYSAEVYPLAVRETGMGFAVATCLFWAAVLGTSFPFLLHEAKTVGAFGVYAGLNIIAFILIFLFVPETMQRSLEELDWIFAVPVHQFARYQVTVALPWFFRRYVLFQKNATKPPLYHFEAVEQAKKQGRYIAPLTSLDNEKRFY